MSAQSMGFVFLTLGPIFLCTGLVLIGLSAPIERAIRAQVEASSVPFGRALTTSKSDPRAMILPGIAACLIGAVFTSVGSVRLIESLSPTYRLDGTPRLIVLAIVVLGVAEIIFAVILLRLGPERTRAQDPHRSRSAALFASMPRWLPPTLGVIALLSGSVVVALPGYLLLVTR